MKTKPKKKLRIIVIMHQDLIPPDSLQGYSDNEIVNWKTEFNVLTTLRKMGHDVRAVGVYDDLGVIRNELNTFEPHIVFNLLEEFNGNSLYDHSVVSYLELTHQAYTGCNPRGLLLAHDKALSKKLLTYHRIRVPLFKVFQQGKKVRLPSKLRYPLIVKSQVEEGSYGIAQTSIVHNEEKLLERVDYLHTKLQTPVIVEEFIEGRELYIAVIGENRLQALPALELSFGNMPKTAVNIATSKVKWDKKYQQTHDIELKLADDLPPDIEKRLIELSKRIYRILELSGYARIDFRLTEDGQIYVLEANANPDIGCDEELSMAAEAVGLDYPALLQKVINLGLNKQFA